MTKNCMATWCDGRWGDVTKHASMKGSEHTDSAAWSGGVMRK